VDPAWLKAHVRDIPDYPKPGVLFRDITPLLAAPDAFAATVDAISAPFADAHIDKVLGIEARGFVFAAPVAYRHVAGFIPVRKAGKLPRATYAVSYALEYGEATLEIHRDAISPGDRVLLVDDVLATGGTLKATRELVEKCGGVVVGAAVLMELAFLPGRETVGDLLVEALTTIRSDS